MKRKILSSYIAFLILLGWILIYTESIFSQEYNPKVQKALEDFKKKRGTNWTVVWHPEHDRVKTFRGKLSPSSSGTPKDVAINFLKENAPIFLINPSLQDLQVESVRETLGGYLVVFRQTFKGLPVFNGKIEVHLKKDNSVFLIHNNYLPNINVYVTPTLMRKKVIELAKNDFFKNCRYKKSKVGPPQPCTGSELTFKTDKVQLGIIEKQGKPYLVYNIVVTIEQNESLFDTWEYYVDAHNGNILEKIRLIQDVRGIGRVFNPNPVNTLNNNTLQDNNDINEAVSNNAYFLKPLRGIREISGLYYLKGPYVEVTDRIEKPYYFSLTSGYIISTSGNFTFKRYNNKFEHVMVYYHIDKTQRYIQSLGFTNVNNRKIKVDPHGLSGADNSHYVANPIGAGYLAFGEGGVDDAEDADIILHEYGHAIQDNQAPGKYLKCHTEAGAMGEGFADYWAASNTYSISIVNGFDPACIGEWDQAPNCLRRVDGNKSYCDKVGECHVDGEIWSAALWDLFKILGRKITDKLVLQSHFLVPDNPTFSEGAQALLDADEQLYGGVHNSTICSVMIKRKIYAPGCNLKIVFDAAGVQGETSVYINGISIGNLLLNDDIPGYLTNTIEFSAEVLQKCDCNEIYIPAHYSSLSDIYDDIQIKNIKIKEPSGHIIFEDVGTYHIGDQTIAEIWEAYYEGNWYDPNPPEFWTELIGSSLTITFDCPSFPSKPPIRDVGDGVKILNHRYKKECQ